MSDIAKELAEKIAVYVVEAINKGEDCELDLESIIRETLDPVLAEKDAEIERLHDSYRSAVVEAFAKVREILELDDKENLQGACTRIMAELTRLRALCGRAGEIVGLTACMACQMHNDDWDAWNTERAALIAEFEQAAKGGEG